MPEREKSKGIAMAKKCRPEKRNAYFWRVIFDIQKMKIAEEYPGRKNQKLRKSMFENLENATNKDGILKFIRQEMWEIKKRSSEFVNPEPWNIKNKSSWER